MLERHAASKCQESTLQAKCCGAGLSVLCSMHALLHVQGMDKLLSILLANATPKQFRGSFITGSALSSFAQVIPRTCAQGRASVPPLTCAGVCADAPT